MYPFTITLSTDKKSKGKKNTCQYLILHHTAWGTFESNCKILSGSVWDVSCHFVVGPKGETAKIGDPKDVLWHAGNSQRWNLVMMNGYSMGIEVVWPDKDWRFTKAQHKAVAELVRHLMKAFNIPKENILCHHDITWKWSKEKKLRDGKSPARKPDLNPIFRHAQWYNTFADYRTYLANA